VRGKNSCAAAVAVASVPLAKCRRIHGRRPSKADPDLELSAPSSRPMKGGFLAGRRETARQRLANNVHTPDARRGIQVRHGL